MDFERWKLFLLVSEMGSLSKAAAVMNRPQPVISRNINCLEEQCGCTLFYRTGRGVVLTEVGENILPRIRAFLAEADQLMLDVRGQAGVPVGSVSVGLLPSLRIAPQIAMAVSEQMPGVDLHLTEASGGQLGEFVATGRVDLAFVLREPGTVGPTEEALLRLPLCLAGPADDPLTNLQNVTLDDIADLPLIMAKPPNALRMFLETAARRRDVRLKFATQVDPLPMQRALVASGMGYTVTSRMAVREEVAKGELSAADIVDPQMELLLVLVRSSQRPATLAIRKVAALIADTVRKLPAQHSADPTPAYLSTRIAEPVC